MDSNGRQVEWEKETVPKKPFILMYHGVVCPGRGVERALEALALLPDWAYLVVLGDGDEAYLESLRIHAKKNEVSKRVHFHPAVPRDSLEAWVAAADVGLVTVEAVSKSYYYMLPNKFFENIQAETPIVASDFPETRRIIEEYKIGLTCNPSNPEEIANCVLELHENLELYNSCLEGLSRAKRDLCWEKERYVLEEAYKGLITK